MGRRHLLFLGLSFNNHCNLRIPEGHKYMLGAVVPLAYRCAGATGGCWWVGAAADSLVGVAAGCCLVRWRPRPRGGASLQPRADTASPLLARYGGGKAITRGARHVDRLHAQTLPPCKELRPAGLERGMGRCVDKGGRTGNEAEVGWSAAPIFLGLGTELG